MTQKKNNAKELDWKEVFGSGPDGLRQLVQQVVQEAGMDEALGAHKSERTAERRVHRARREYSQARGSGVMGANRRSVIPGRHEGASPESITTTRAYGFRALGLRPRPGMTEREERVAA